MRVSAPVSLAFLLVLNAVLQEGRVTRRQVVVVFWFCEEDDKTSSLYSSDAWVLSGTLRRVRVSVALLQQMVRIVEGLEMLSNDECCGDQSLPLAATAENCLSIAHSFSEAPKLMTPEKGKNINYLALSPLAQSRSLCCLLSTLPLTPYFFFTHPPLFLAPPPSSYSVNPSIRFRKCLKVRLNVILHV